MDIPTITVRRDGPKGYKIINLSDFDPKRHEVYEPAVSAPFNGADPAAFDHDQDGKPGGSKPRRRKAAQ